jgi:adenylyltransferase/sulfurtransferase
VVREIEPRELAARLRAGEATYLLDVRQPWEHAAAALPGSVLVPLPELAARAAEVRPPEGALTVVYCHHGVRSLHAAAYLQRLGLGDVATLAGGIDAWSVEIDPSVPRY